MGVTLFLAALLSGASVDPAAAGGPTVSEVELRLHAGFFRLLDVVPQEDIAAPTVVLFLVENGIV